MRLHRLQMEAFGPFAGTEVVDFDALAEPGLFLLHGPTGAGKTTVLDAVCFALYGQVPGARAAGRPRLTSDHAAAGSAPRVVLELTVGGRRLEVTRSPEWLRPKKRGTGTTREPASTDVRELVDGEWRVVVGRRSDEAALLLHGLLGMGLEQFTKVVLLPQGEFAAFLRSSAEQRGELLGRLFSIDRFTQAESWLRDERQRLSREVAAADAEQAALVARADEAMAPIAGTPMAGQDEIALASPYGAEVVGALAGAATGALASARADTERARAVAATAETHLADALHAARRSARRAEVLQRLAELDARAQARTVDVDRLGAARRAAPLQLAVSAVDESSQALAATAAVLEARRCAAPPSLTDADDLDAELASRQVELARLEDAAALVDELTRHRERARQLEDQAATAAITEAAAEAARETAGDEVVRLSGEVERCGRVAADLPAAQQALADAEAMAVAAREAEVCDLQGQRARDARRGAQDAELSAREHLLEVRERRLQGIAAELAQTLVDGEACTVCGSTEHPRPARAGAGHVDRAAEVAARGAHEAAAVALRDAEAVVSDLTARRAALRVAAKGLDVADAERAVEAALSRVHHAEQCQARAEHAQTALTAARQAVQRHQDERDVARRERTVATTAIQELAPRVAALHATVVALSGEDDDLVLRQRRLSGELEAVEAWRVARIEHASATGHRDSQQARLLRAVADTGFPSVQAARTSLLDPATLDELVASVEAYERARADGAALLTSPELAADDAPVPDLAAAREAAGLATSALRTAEHRLAVTEHAEKSLRRLAQNLRDHDAVHVDLRARYAQVDELSRCVDGTGGGNTRRMRLSSFVLAARLEEVALAASERLLAMSDGRYTLVHSDELAKGGARSGLGLQVVDGWTGAAREATTLSGGESFLASLALALGLADVVQHEAGGSSIETLFVDEGFGSLDDDTLEEVMAVLDGLREGGRIVGIVSHVADLKHRIPAQVEVRKTRRGSTVVQHGLDRPQDALAPAV